MNKPMSFPPSPARILSSHGTPKAAEQAATAQNDQPHEATPAKTPSSRAKISHEKIVRPPLAMRYSHF